MRAPAQRPGDSAGCSGGSGSTSYTGSYAGSWHQDRTDLRASAAVHHRPVSSRAGQAPSGGQLIEIETQGAPKVFGRQPAPLAPEHDQAFNVRVARKHWRLSRAVVTTRSHGRIEVQ